MNFIINNQENFPTNSSIQNIKTREKHHLHRSHAKLPSFKKKYILCCHKTFQKFPTHCDNAAEWSGKI